MLQYLDHPLAVLRATAWDRLLGLAFFMLAMAFILGLAAQLGSPRASLRPLVLYLVLGLFVAKVVSGGYGGFCRRRTAKALGQGWGAQLAALAPPWLIMWMHTDRANLLACMQWLTRRPYPPRPIGVNHPFLENSSYRTVMLCGLLVILVELPLDTLIASVMTPDPELRRRLQWLLGGLGLYSLMWMLGDRRQMLGGYQVVGAHTLELHVGGRLKASIPLAAITCCDAISETVARWSERHRAGAADTLLATPADTPNVVIGIDPAAALQLSSWSVEREAPRYLFLFADAPGALVGALLSGGKLSQLGSDLNSAQF